MKQSVVALSKYERLFLRSLLEDGSKSDAQIARETSMGKATANRIRKDLEDRKVITEYLPVVDLDMMGINVFMLVLFHWKRYKDEKLTEGMLSHLEHDPHVVFLASGEGSGFTHVLFLGFTDLSEAHIYFSRLRKKYEDVIDNTLTFFTPTSEIKKQDYTELVRSTLR